LRLPSESRGTFEIRGFVELQINNTAPIAAAAPEVMRQWQEVCDTPEVGQPDSVGAPAMVSRPEDKVEAQTRPISGQGCGSDTPIRSSALRCIGSDLSDWIDSDLFRGISGQKTAKTGAGNTM
jgi:hypothetical protein